MWRHSRDRHFSSGWRFITTFSKFSCYFIRFVSVVMVAEREILNSSVQFETLKTLVTYRFNFSRMFLPIKRWENHDVLREHVFHSFMLLLIQLFELLTYCANKLLIIISLFLINILRQLVLFQFLSDTVRWIHLFKIIL